MRTATLFLLALLPRGPLALGQAVNEPRIVAPGARVRVSALGVGREIGTAAQVRGDTIMLITERLGDTLIVARSSIKRLDVSLGRSATAGARTGVVWGAALGAAGGLIFMVTASCTQADGTMCKKSSSTDSKATGIGLGASFLLATATTGGLLGWAVGRAIGAERWENVGLGSRLNVTPRSFGVSVAVSSRLLR